MKRYCTFTVGDLFIGIEVERVQEVLRHERITPVPLAPEHVRGLINLRGRIVTAVDMKSRLGIAEHREGDHDGLHVILSDHGATVSLMVDRSGDVVEVDAADYEEPPETLRGEARRLIKGAYKLAGRLLLELDTDYAIGFGEA